MQAGDTGRGTLVYPNAARGDVVDVYHGVQVPDPYRWMEDLDAPQVKAWVDAENRVTFSYLNAIPARPTIAKRITRLWDYKKYGVPRREGDRYFVQQNDGLQNQSVLYTMSSLTAEPRVLLDPNKLSDDGTASLSGYYVSHDGTLMAYGLADAGSDWKSFRVRDVATGRDLDDHVKWVKFSGASWTKDGKGFFYSRYDEPKPDARLEDVNYYQKLYYHRIGTPQAADTLIYERRDEKEWGFDGHVTEDGRYLIISVWKGSERKNLLFYKDLTGAGGDIVQLISKFDAQYEFIGNDGPVFWLLTNDAAPRYRVIAIDTRSPRRDHWKPVIAQSLDTLRNVALINNTFVASYLQDAHTLMRVFDLKGRHLRDVDLPGIGTARGFRGRRDHTETFYAFTSYTTPSTVYRYDMVTGKSTVFRKPRVDFASDRYVTRQVFYRSKDGTSIPMFITHKRGLLRNRNNPTLLYGYGGFNIAITPSFSVTMATWLEMGGVYAVANIRGGGEYGQAWHDGGRLLNKQNCFDDFIAAAEWLVANHYTRPERLAISGRSNGGLLVGACMTQRPDLFGAALPGVGVMDMLRFNKFTIGWAWTSDYGSPQDPELFKALYAYSPLHNIKPGTAYPATLITTADHDDRVVPAHSFKFAATLQAAHAGTAPVLIRIETRAGHGAGKPTSKRIEEAADGLAFLADVFDMRLPPAFTGAAGGG
ncbi:MAG: prolyl oligopeptidase family protein [Phycisphaerae bacterium]